MSNFYSLLNFFFSNCGFVIFLEKQNATHSSSKPRLVERDFHFENGGRGPCNTNTWLIPSTGLVYLQREEPHGTGEWTKGGVRWRGWGFPLSSMGETFQRACEQLLLTNRDDCAWHCWPLPGSVHYRKFRGWAGQRGSSVHSVGKAGDVSHPLVETTVPPQSVHLSLHPLPLPWTQPTSCLFFMQFYLARGPDIQMDGNIETSYLKQTIPLCYWIIISQRKKKSYCVTSTSFFSTSGKWREKLQWGPRGLKSV